MYIYSCCMWGLIAHDVCGERSRCYVGMLRIRWRETFLQFLFFSLVVSVGCWTLSAGCSCWCSGSVKILLLFSDCPAPSTSLPSCEHFGSLFPSLSRVKNVPKECKCHFHNFFECSQKTLHRCCRQSLGAG